MKVKELSMLRLRKILFVFLVVVSFNLLFPVIGVSRSDVEVVIREEKDSCNNDWRDEYPPCPYAGCIPYHDDAFWDEPVEGGGQRIICENNCTWYLGWCCRILRCNCGTSSSPCWQESPAYADCESLCAELGCP